MAKKNSELASVLAFEKKFVFSDGYMYSTNWNERHQIAAPFPAVHCPLSESPGSFDGNGKDLIGPSRHSSPTHEKNALKKRRTRQKNNKE